MITCKGELMNGEMRWGRNEILTETERRAGRKRKEVKGKIEEEVERKSGTAGTGMKGRESKVGK